jgi:hypothetical protein
VWQNRDVALRAQHKTKRKSSFYRNVPQSRAFAQRAQLVRLKTSQYRQRAIMPQQAIVQHQFSQRRVKQIRDRVPVQIDNKYSPPRNATHLLQNLDHLLVSEVMRKQRTNHIIKLGLRKRQRQGIATHGANFVKLL